MIKIIRQKTLNNSQILSNFNIKIFLLSLQFSLYLKDLFYNKNILLTQVNLNINSNIANLFMSLFYRKKLLIKFRTFNFVKKKKLNSINNNKNIILFLSKHLNNKFNINSINLKIKVVNKLIIFPFFFKALKKELKMFKKTLFDRRFGLYVDFLKLNVLYHTSQADLNTYVFLLGEIFRRLTKKKHGKFLIFIKMLFKFIIVKYKFKSIYDKILGMKFIISGKIKGKLRARNTSIQIGLIPISTHNKNIEFSKTSVFTIYGTYGIKLWVYKKPKVVENISQVVSKIKLALNKKENYRVRKVFNRKNLS